jgi:hypothetical protein
MRFKRFDRLAGEFSRPAERGVAGYSFSSAILKRD